MRDFKRETGFTLVEIVVASVLLAIIAAGIFSISLSSKKIITISSQRSIATDVTETILDTLRAYLGDDNWTTGGTNSPFTAILDQWQPQPNGNYYNFTTDGQTAYNGFVDRVADIFRDTEFDTRYHGRWRFKVIQPNDCSGPCDYRKVEVEVVWDEVQM